jgi:hypothetical protein
MATTFTRIATTGSTQGLPVILGTSASPTTLHTTAQTGADSEDVTVAIVNLSGDTATVAILFDISGTDVTVGLRTLADGESWTPPSFALFGTVAVKLYADDTAAATNKVFAYGKVNQLDVA